MSTLERALSRVGATVVKQTAKEKQSVLFLRVDVASSDKWVTALAEILLGSQNVSWTIDISKYFFVDRGAIRYLWRVVISNDVTNGLIFIEQCVVGASTAHVKELTSFPLVGRATYNIDVARGKTKGAHGAVNESGIDHAHRVLSAHFIR